MLTGIGCFPTDPGVGATTGQNGAVDDTESTLNVADGQTRWAEVEAAWARTMDEAAALPESVVQQRVNGEWSLVETLRHLVFANDAWVGRTISGEESPYHRLGWPKTEYTPPASMGLDPAARPTFAEVVAVRTQRQALTRQVLAGLSEADLAGPWVLPPVPDFSGPTMTIADSVSFLLEEETGHHRYAVRDLAILQNRER